VAAIPCLEITMDRAWVRSWQWVGMAIDSAAPHRTAIRDRNSIGDSDDSRIAVPGQSAEIGTL
jgi:hypothetical protein